MHVDNYYRSGLFFFLYKLNYFGASPDNTRSLLIIRGINVFPSQVESVVLSMKEFAPRYLLVVDRINNLDTLEVQVELRQEYFTATFDTPAAIDELKKKLRDKLRSVLSFNAKVQLKAPNAIERSQGKSVRVIDNRKLQ